MSQDTPRQGMLVDDISRSPAASAYQQLHDLVTTRPVIDPIVVELCRLRSAMLMDVPDELQRRSTAAVDAGMDEETVRDLPRWPTSPRFDDRMRAAVRFTEAFLFGSEQARAEVDDLRRHFSSEEVFALGVAVAFHESFHLLCHAVGHPSAEHPTGA